jgi:hypothetical protein
VTVFCVERGEGRRLEEEEVVVVIVVEDLGGGGGGGVGVWRNEGVGI